MTQSNCILPMAMRIAAQTIGNDLVSVHPIGISSEKLNNIKSRILRDNRDSKIESIINNTPHIDISIYDDEEYKLSGMPNSQLFYLDYTYGTSK